MNRDAHLRRSLQHWVTIPDIDEIVIVDWSNHSPLHGLVEVDARIRIVRVEGEPRWILPYAYNLGIARAHGEVILKCDSDCLPDSSITSLRPDNGHFYSGDWRTGAPVGKTCVNGQCLFTKTQWRQVNGYSDLLRRYGHDDVDFYDRLEAAGHARREIPPAQLNFLEHTDADRVAYNPRPAIPASVEKFLHEQLSFHEAINVVITSLMPWGIWYPQAEYKTISSGDRSVTLQRDQTREIPISEPLLSFATNNAIRTVASRICDIPPARMKQMDTASCLAQIGLKMNKLKAAS